MVRSLPNVAGAAMVYFYFGYVNPWGVQRRPAGLAASRPAEIAATIQFGERNDLNVAERNRSARYDSGPLAGSDSNHGSTNCSLIE